MARERYNCVMGCRDYAHAYRATTEECREIWRKRLNLRRLLRFQRVCNNHFSEAMFTNRKRKRLTRCALPDINLVREGSDDEGSTSESPSETDSGAVEEPQKNFSEAMCTNRKQTALPDINKVMPEVSNEEETIAGPPIKMDFGVAEEPTGLVGNEKSYFTCVTYW